MFGADTTELRATAVQFAQAADRLDSSMLVLNSHVSNAAYWLGPDAQRFRSDWQRQSAVMRGAIAALRGAVDALYRNADEQDGASRADGGGSGSGSAGGVEPVRAAAPDNTAELWSAIHSKVPKDSSGYHVEKIMGPDGEFRYIVYIGGTDAGDAHKGVDSNIRAVTGRLDEAQVAEIAKLTGTDAEVMLVGFSQGGMDAQNIAASGRLNVTQVVTFGSPARGDLDVPVIHLRAGGDMVPMSASFVPRHELVFNPYQNSMAQRETDDIKFYEASSGRPPWGDHHGGYDNVAKEYDRAVADGSEVAQSNIADFRGAIYESTTIPSRGAGSGGGGW